MTIESSSTVGASPPEPVQAVEPARLLLVAILGEGLLALAGLVWVRYRALPVAVGDPIRGVAAGAAAAALLAAINFGILRYAPPVRPVRAMRRLYDELFVPLFARIGAREIVLVSVAAGCGEELLFRGAVQGDAGWLAASVLFGAAHIGSVGTMTLGVWAAMVGGFLGWLYVATGGILAPIVAHACYDAFALAYVRASGRARGTRPENAEGTLE